MAQQKKKLVEDITSMEEDFSQWYTDVVKKAELMDYSSVKGCMVIEPYGYALWENMQHDLDARFKKVGVQNVYMPMFIPESLLQKEKDHVEGFAPECAIVTEGGGEKLAERLYVRPTSETLFCEHIPKDHPFLSGSAQAVQPVVQRGALGKDHPPLPALFRVFVAGRPHHARDRRGSPGVHPDHAEGL